MKQLTFINVLLAACVFSMAAPSFAGKQPSPGMKNPSAGLNNIQYPSLIYIIRSRGVSNTTIQIGTKQYNVGNDVVMIQDIDFGVPTDSDEKTSVSLQQGGSTQTVEMPVSKSRTVTFTLSNGKQLTVTSTTPLSYYQDENSPPSLVTTEGISIYKIEYE